MSKSVSCDQNINDDINSDENFQSKILSSDENMKFPLGDFTYVTIKGGESQPHIEILPYDHFKIANDQHLIVPKDRGVKLTTKQFSKLIKSTRLIKSAVKSLTKSKHNLASKCLFSTTRQVKRKSSKPKDKVDKSTLRYQAAAGNSIQRPKKDSCTQTEVKDSNNVYYHLFD